MYKSKQLLTAAAFGAIFISATGCEKEQIMQSGKIPGEIETYASTHFPANKIIQVVEDRDGFTKTYDVILEGNIQLEFNRGKEIISIDGTEKLPDSVVPEKIRNYVTGNYPDNFITDWELDNKNQQVGLDNDLDLEFTMSGDFIRIDG